MSRTRNPSIPPIPAGTPKELRPFLESIRSTLQVQAGQGRGNSKDRAVTFRDLQETGLVDKSNRPMVRPSTDNGSGGGSVPPTPDEPVENPTKPLDVHVFATFENIGVRWLYPKFKGYAFTEIFIVSLETVLMKQGFDEKFLVGTTSGVVFPYYVPKEGNYRVWVRHVNTLGVRSPLHDPLGSDVYVKKSPAGDIGDQLDDILEWEDSQKDNWLSQLIDIGVTAENKLDELKNTADLIRITNEIKTSNAAMREELILYTDTETGEALAIARKELEAGDAKISEESKAYSDELGNQLATAIDKVETANAAVEQRMTAAENNLGDIEANWQISTSVNGLTSSIGLVNDGKTSTCYVRADRFYVRNPDRPDDESQNLFVVKDGEVYINTAVIDTAYINDLIAGTVTADYINAFEITADKFSGNQIFGVAIRGGDLGIGDNGPFNNYHTFVDGDGRIHTDRLFMQSNQSGSRMEINGETLTVYENGSVRVKLGKLR